MGGGRAMKGGIGSVALVTADGLIVGAIVAVNAVGSVIDPRTAKPVAGVRTADGSRSRRSIRAGAARRVQSGPAREATTIGVVVTNARLTKAQAQKAVEMAHDGLARAIVPSHTPSDGDTLFMMATGDRTAESNVGTIGALAAEAVADAIVRAVQDGARPAGISRRFRHPLTRSDLLTILLVVYLDRPDPPGLVCRPGRARHGRFFCRRPIARARVSSSQRFLRRTSAPARRLARRAMRTAMDSRPGGGMAARAWGRWCWRSGSARGSGRKPMQRGLLTVGDFLEDHYGKEVRAVAALIIWASSFFILCAQLKGAALVLERRAGWDLGSSAPCSRLA